MLKKAALLFGAVLLLVGVLGFVPALAPKDSGGMPLLISLFAVGAVHNLIHILSGIAALAAGYTSEAYAKLYFQIFGVVYAIVTVVGFVQKDTVLGLFHVNLADNLLHVAIAAAALALGFGVKNRVAAREV